MGARPESAATGGGWRPSAAARIGWALVLGVACGLFFGELVAWMSSVGAVYIGLLQMTVLPYVFVTLVAKIPRMAAQGGGAFALRAGAVLALLWAIGCLTVVLVPLALPEWRSARFFGTLGSGVEQLDLLELYIPVNPFNALAKGLVPAIVVFAISIGLALARTPGHEGFVEQLDVLDRALGRISSYLTRFMPLGVFALASGAAATMTIEELGRLQGYFAIYLLAVLVLVYGVLPSLLASLTPFSRRDILAVSKEPLITAFATGKLLVVLPSLIDATERLFARRGLDPGTVRARASILIPLGYAFPHLGKLLVLLFPAFGAWYGGEPLDVGQYGRLVSAGLASSFGSPLLSVPLLLDLLELPEDLFQLFIVSGVITTRLGDLVGVAHLMVLTALTIVWASGGLRLATRTAWVSLAGLGLVLVPALIGTRALLSWSLSDSYSLDEAVRRMELVGEPRPFERLPEAAPNPVPKRPGETCLERIDRRGIARVGYVPDAVPFSFVNQVGTLVGFDVDMAHQLADDMGVALEFVPVERGSLVEQLNADHCDLVMAGIVGRFDLIREVRASKPYLEATIAFVVRDHLDVSDLAQLAELRIYHTWRQRTPERIHRHFPRAELVPVESENAFFELSNHDADVLLCTAEEGSVFTVLRPEYKVVSPLAEPLRIPLVYPVGTDGESLAELLDHWIDLKVAQGQIDVLYAHWIQGRGTEQVRPRWSVVRDVLGWVE